MRISKRQFFSFLIVAFAAMTITGCSGTSSAGDAGDPNAIAARVNGKDIKMEEVERAVNQQAQGQASRLSPLELAGARLQVLESLVQREVMFQKAEKEGTVPTEEEITAEINKQKTQSGKSADQIDREMQQQGLTEAAVREEMKKGLAIQKLVDKISARIGPPKDAEIEQFYNGNKAAFVKKKGVKLAAIVIDPAKTSEDDQTIDEQSAVLKGNEIIKKLQQGVDFAQLARENSEDQSRFQGGDLPYLSEDDLKQAFPAQTVANLMSPEFQVGKILTTTSQGRFYILKLQERGDRDEAVTLETPGVRQQVTDSLINARKQLLQASYQTMAMNEAKIENFLAKRVVDNPNELSGARPATAEAPTANTNAGAAPANTGQSAPVSQPSTNSNSSVSVTNGGNATRATPPRPAATPRTANATNR